MKLHTTNYFDTFIVVAEDTKATSGTIPPSKEKPTIAEMQYKLIAENPYKLTSDDVLYQVFAVRNDFNKAEHKKERELFFSKEHPCFRSSPLTKTYGFGIHSNNEGKIALFGMETKEYQKFIADKQIRKVKAMKSNK
jgi:hypothetical protein